MTTVDSMMIRPRAVLTIAGGAARAIEGDDAKATAGRAAQVVAFDVGGTRCYLLVRWSSTRNGIFVDLLAAESLEALATASDDMNLGSTSGHPNPGKDCVDELALEAALASALAAAKAAAALEPEPEVVVAATLEPAGEPEPEPALEPEPEPEATLAPEVEVEVEGTLDAELDGELEGEA